MITQPPNESSFDDGQKPRKSWVDWCMSVFRDFKYKGSGPTSSRPVNGLSIGDWFFDTTINRPVFVINISPVTWSDIGFSTYFESAQQTVTAAGALTLAHGLGKEPILVAVVLVCTTNDSGYVTGNKLFISFTDDFGAADGTGVSVVPDATNLNIRYGSQVNVFRIIHKTTGVQAATTLGNWKVIFRAWA